MAAPKVFVSSTCYDLGQIRNQMHSFLGRFGYEPVLSEYSDVLFDPRQHTHKSCVQGVKTCDMVVVFIGARFGGSAVPEALQLIDWEKARQSSNSTALIEGKEKLSITQAEVFSAIENGIPVFPFVETHVYHDHRIYEKNKDKSIIDEMEFPSIEKEDTSKYIFEFINFLRHRTHNNAVVPFDSFEEIEEHLTKQWASLFQRLLQESILDQKEQFRGDILLEKLENLETALISTIEDDRAKNIARYTMRFRRLVDFLTPISSEVDRQILYTEKGTFTELLALCDIARIEDFQGIREARGPWRSALIKNDDTYFLVRLPYSAIDAISQEWASFTDVSIDERRLVVDAIMEQDDHRFPVVRYFRRSFADEFGNSRDDDDEIPF